MMTQINRDEIRQRLAASVGGEGEFATWFSNRTFADLNARAARLLDEAADDVLAMLGRISRAIDAEGLREWHQTSDEEYVARYIRFWSAYQRAGSQVANWFITGPANFPVARNQKRIATEDRRWEELSAFSKTAGQRAVRRAQRVRKAAVGASGLMDAELADLRARHEKRIARQEMMKAVNRLIRKHKLTEDGNGPAQLAALAREANHPIGEALAREILKPNYMGARGFEGFSLSNNNAEIRRLAGRIEQVKAKLTNAQSVEAGDTENKTRSAGDIEIVENAAEDRLQLIFPGKPSADVRAALKSGGFRWSPRQGAWQRQLTNAARHAADRVLAQIGEQILA